MRWFVVTAILLVAVALGVGFFVHARQGHAQPPISLLQTRVVTIPVEGMVCLACTARVKSTLKAINGVAEVEVNLAGRVARVEYLEGRVALPPDRISKATKTIALRATH